MNSIDFKRMQHAHQAVASIVAEDHGHYLSYIKAMPAEVLQLGLGQALARQFSNRKQDLGHQLVFNHLASWLGASPRAVYHDAHNDNDNEALINAIGEGDVLEYLRASQEALAYLNWLKKFATALLIKDQQHGVEHA